MGKGDIKTKKGKRRAGSYGVTRKRKKSKPAAVAVKPAKKPAAKKSTAKKSSKKTDKAE
jgi:ribosomal small subunit protein bTHX